MVDRLRGSRLLRIVGALLVWAAFAGLMLALALLSDPAPCSPDAPCFPGR